METSPHQEPAALIQCLGLKSVSLIRVIIAQMLWEICNPPTAPTSRHGGHFQLTQVSVHADTDN